MCWIADRLEKYSVKFQLCGYGARNKKMADVHRIEGAAQYAQA
jgi:hypothetical protein